ncbi:YkgJ family cysteine cluster protein [bacterium]|nr:YkgJ family cysteine cluster protein [bacterium]
MTDWHFPAGQRFQCSQCGLCCRGWRIHVDAQTAARLKGTPEARRLEHKDGRVFVRKDAEQRCSFLTPTNRCELHDRAKPAGCRQFPFRLTRTPDGVFVGASFFCPSIQANEGLDLSEFQPELEEAVAHLPIWGAEGLRVWNECRLKWADYRRLESHILEHPLLEEGLAQALWSLAQFSLNPGRNLNEYLQGAQAALEPPDEPLVLMEHHWYENLMRHLGEKPDRRTLQAPAAPLERYLRAVLQRKGLINRRALLGNLALLFLVPRFYRHWNTTLGSPERAIQECENKIVTHPNNLDDLVERMSDDFRELDPV